MLQQVDRHLWVAEQPLKFMGLSVGTRMTIIELTDNSLLLISPIQITPKIKQQLDTLGKVKYLIAPNLFHYSYLAECKAMYPEAKIIAPPGLEIKQPDLLIDKTFTQDEIEFNSELEYTLFAGLKVLMIPQIKAAKE